MEHSIMSERAPVARVGASNINRQLDELAAFLRCNRIEYGSAAVAGASAAGSNANLCETRAVAIATRVQNLGSPLGSGLGPASKLGADELTMPKLRDLSVSGKMPDAPKQRAYDQVLSGLLQQAELKLKYVCDEVKRRERALVQPLRVEIKSLRHENEGLTRQVRAIEERARRKGEGTLATLERRIELMKSESAAAIRAAEDKVRQEAQEDFAKAKQRWVDLLLGNDEEMQLRYKEAAVEAARIRDELQARLDAVNRTREEAQHVGVQAEPPVLEEQALSEDELARRVQYMLQTKTRYMSQTQLEDLFSKYDDDYSGYLDEFELQAACRSIRGLDKLTLAEVVQLKNKLHDLGIDDDVRRPAGEEGLGFKSFVRFIKEGRNGTVVSDASTQTTPDDAQERSLAVHATLLRAVNGLVYYEEEEERKREELEARLEAERLEEEKKKSKKGKKKGKKGNKGKKK
eukprot:g2750.t1